MDFLFDPNASKQTGLVVITFQTAGTLLIALLLRLLTRGVPGRFLHYWSDAWAALAAALVALSLSSLVAPLLDPDLAPWIRRPALAGYAVCEYLFGFYLWAGAREYARGIPLTRSDWWLFAPPAAFGLVAPVFLPDIDALYPFHTLIFGGFCLLALLATLTCHPDSRQTLVGLRLTQIALATLTVLFWHYSVVVGWLLLHPQPRPDLAYLRFSALYDALTETLLGFGMVVLGTDSVRRALEANNRALAETNKKLAEAMDQLALAARTDPLTGLLNRRALDAFLAERGNGPFAGSVAVVDVNDLKQLNDVHGHAAGDAAIQLVARALRGQFRITDLVFRTGGDEFLAILEGGRSAELYRRLEAVDNALRAQRLPGVPNPVPIVIAWGMADFESPDGFAEALAKADAAMYACKLNRKTARAG